jgi:hypothetical protein
MISKLVNFNGFNRIYEGLYTGYGLMIGETEYLKNS